MLFSAINAAAFYHASIEPCLVHCNIAWADSSERRCESAVFQSDEAIRLITSSPWLIRLNQLVRKLGVMIFCNRNSLYTSWLFYAQFFAHIVTGLFKMYVHQATVHSQ